ncbi:MAG: aspartate 1-decarboxylase [Thermodesulfobacteriota bacterium]|nr:aspartate 1-decarboxylase [Thermodesulfobacteriota bacterium]
MLRIMCNSKIHRATVTDANLDYEGSITIDETLLKLAGILPYEMVHIYNITNGERFETYALAGEMGKGEICLNGAAAHKVKIGDLIIIANYQMMDEKEARSLKPRMILVDEKNIPVKKEFRQAYMEKMAGNY